MMLFGDVDEWINFDRCNIVLKEQTQENFYNILL